MTTTVYGTWTTVVGDLYSSSPAEAIENIIENTMTESDVEFDADRYEDLCEAIVSDYIDAINAALPAGVSLHGSEFYGPYRPADDAWDGYPTDEDGYLDIKAVVDDIDVWEIIWRHVTEDQA